MRRILTPLVVLALLLAGCSDPPDREGPQDPLDATGPSLPTPSVVHDANGTVEGLEEVVEDVLLARGTHFEMGYPVFEPTIGATSSGALLVTSTGENGGTVILRSRDQGRTWEAVGPYLASTDVEQVPSSGDPFLHVDRWTDRLLKFDMHGLACMTLETSDDEGETWSPPTPACGQPVGVVHDHQSIAAAPPAPGVTTVGYDSVLVQCVNRALNILGSWCSTSLDGGLAWTPLVPGFPPDRTQCMGVSGHLVGDAEGRFYRGGPGCAGLTSGDGLVPTVWRSGDGGLTWSQHPLPSDEGLLGHDVNLAVDEAGTLYAFWNSAGGRALLTWSTDHGDTWADPLDVTAPDVTATGFATVDAGAPGRVAFAYIGTTQPGGYDQNDADMTWNGYLGVIVDILAPAPVIQTVLVNDPAEPLYVGPCGDRRCSGFGDFIDMVVDPTGRPWVALSKGEDVHVPIAGTPVQLSAGMGIAATLAAGPALRGPLEPLPELPLPDGTGAG